MMIENDHNQAARRDAIRRILRLQRVGTQEDLRRELAREGFDVTQATLSRDLARLGARRVSLPGGGTAYELEDAKVSEGEEALGQVKHLVISVEDSAAVVVVQTLPGAASAVAVQLDRARLPGVLGSIAGDDTIFIAPARGIPIARLSKQLKSIWRGGGLPARSQGGPK